MPKLADTLLQLARRIRLVTFDVDGVLTDGRLYYGEHGETLKVFHVQDGAALKLLREQGVEVGFITGRDSKMVAQRAAELGIAHVFQGVSEKGLALDAVCKTLGLSDSEVAHVGDDLPDIALFRRVGFAIGVPNGHPTTHDHVHLVTTVPGGAGVAREVAELLLRAQERWPYDTSTEIS
jgi:3-deoxy-D-manno-octulosonate 8-phosphate phosphatase (KDO 8-P phosphatase)